MPFVLYARARIFYNGRANSVSDIGNYLIVHKSDGTILIHANNHVTPMNYQPPGATLIYRDNKLISTMNGETIEVEIIGIMYYEELMGLSNKSIQLNGSEKDIVDRFCDVIDGYNYSREFITSVGIIDVLVKIDEIFIIIEFKRKTANISACSQVHRYINHFKSSGCDCIGILAAPEFSNNSINYLKNNKILYHRLRFDDEESFGQLLDLMVSRWID